MIPGKIVRFLGEHANVATSGTRDQDLVPHGHRVSAWRVGKELETITCFIPEAFTRHLVESLEDNGHFALTVEEIPSHETYQFKGRYVSHRTTEPEDLAIVAEIRERFVKGLRTHFPDMPAEALGDYILEPRLAVSFKVHEIYLQTPGPGAGTRISPPLET